MSEVKIITEGQEEFEEYPDMTTSVVPDFTQILKQRIVPAIQPNLPGFDPHQMMVKKHKIETGEIAPDSVPEVKWPDKDIKALEEFCKQYGIVGFSSKLHPSVALAFLKDKMGLFDKPLSERIPIGYEKTGIKNIYNSNYPYNKPDDRRKIISG